jgi:hypothetical protein
MNDPAITSPITLPSLPRAQDRQALLAALEFMEAVAAGVFDREALERWIDTHLVSTGRALRPSEVWERPVGSFPLFRPSGRPEMLSRVLDAARTRVVATLRGFTSPRRDDSFIAAALFGERVQRIRVGTKRIWIARPRVRDSLSDIVLALFVVDMLTYRDHYDQALCVCDTCGRISFVADPHLRGSCFEHVPLADPEVIAPRASA